METSGHDTERWTGKIQKRVKAETLEIIDFRSFIELVMITQLKKNC